MASKLVFDSIYNLLFNVDPSMSCRGQRRPFDSQFEDLQQHYLQMRQQQIGGNKRRRLDSIPTGRSDDRVPSGPMEIDGPQAEAGGTSDARGLLSVWASRVLAPAADSGHTVVGPAEPGGLREFSRMLSMSRRSNFEVSHQKLHKPSVHALMHLKS